MTYKELTLENVICFLNEYKFREEGEITVDSDIAYTFGYGLDIDDLLISLGDAFGVSFEYFDYGCYFYPEDYDLNLKGCLMMVVKGLVMPFQILVAIIRWVFNISEQYKRDYNKELCTPVTLYEYMMREKRKYNN